jgi:hypothetical protein
MRKTVLFILFIGAAIFLSLDLTSCKKNSPTDSGISDTTEPLGFREAFYPMAVGNSWTYADSIFTDSLATVSVYTDTIIGYHNYTFGTEWKFSRRSDGMTITNYSLIEINDTVYNFQNNWNARIEVPKYFNLFGRDSAIFSSVIGGDAVIYELLLRSQGPYTTPASVFTNCLFLEYSIIEEDFIEVLCPKIGLVGKDVTLFNVAHDQIKSMEHTRLLRYHLVK